MSKALTTALTCRRSHTVVWTRIVGVLCSRCMRALPGSLPPPPAAGALVRRGDVLRGLEALEVHVLGGLALKPRVSGVETEGGRLMQQLEDEEDKMMMTR